MHGLDDQPRNQLVDLDASPTSVHIITTAILKIRLHSISV